MILAFAGSNSSTSINYKLVNYTVSLIEEHQIEQLDMAELFFPIFSEDEEKANGYSDELIKLKDHIDNANGIVLSVNEHNSNPSAYFKNVLDWLSRMDRKFLQETKVFLMATSPGKGGAKYALEAINKVLPRFKAEVVETFSLPSFNENFEEGKGILNSELAKEHSTRLEKFLASL